MEIKIMHLSGDPTEIYHNAKLLLQLNPVLRTASQYRHPVNTGHFL